MTFRDAQFTDEAYFLVKEYYSFHNHESEFEIFDEVLKLKCDFGMYEKNGLVHISRPVENLAEKFERHLGRCSWVMYEDRVVRDVAPSQFSFLYSVSPLLTFEDDFVKIEGYAPHPQTFHILCAKAKKKSLLNYKKFRRQIGKILERYDVVTASCAQNPDRHVGMEMDWRFEGCRSNSTRLLEFWRNVGFQSYPDDKWKLKISKAGHV